MTIRATCAAAIVGIGLPAVAWAQSGPSPISLSDLLNGGWSQSKHYEPDFKTKGAADKSNLEWEKKQFDKSQEKAKQGWDYAKKGYEKGKWAYGVLTKYDDMMKAFEHLTPKDGPFDPNYTPPGMPQVPSNCAGSKECGVCYEEAHGKLTAVLVRLEKLRVLGTSTHAWIARALSFGDDTSSIHGIAGLAWQTERRKIEQSVGTFDAAYDAKYAELIGLLSEALHAIDECEARFFGERDWYNRFGFIYFTFMSDRYKR